MLEFMRNKYIIITTILVIVVSVMTGLDNKKTAEAQSQNGQINEVLYK
jgi:hypothetical protein